MDRVTLDELLARHRPADDTEAGYVARMRELLGREGDPFSRAHVDPGHFTASAFLLSPDQEQVLLILHGKLGLWLQPGGHVEPEDRDIFAAALRETEEEAGATDVVVGPGSPRLLDLDIHEIPANPGKGEPAHAHYDVRVLLQARSWDLVAGSDAVDARWVPLDQVRDAGTDDSVRRAVRKLQRRLRWADPEHRRCAPAAERNREPILSVLTRWIPAGAEVLEVASGSGEHAAYLAPRLGCRWQPSELGESGLRSVSAWRTGVEAHVLPPVRLDTRELPWRAGTPEVVLAINMVHISPWESTVSLFAGACQAGASQVVLYGPYRMGGVHTSPSNAAFDASLRSRDPSWGVRDLEAVVGEAERHGFVWLETEPMPANNFMVRFSSGSARP